jgi:hypothetical protein
MSRIKIFLFQEFLFQNIKKTSVFNPKTGWVTVGFFLVSVGFGFWQHRFGLGSGLYFSKNPVFGLGFGKVEDTEKNTVSYHVLLFLISVKEFIKNGIPQSVPQYPRIYSVIQF